MKKIVFSVLAALSLATTSTMAVAAPMPAPVVTPLTQPASEQVTGENELAGIHGIGALFGFIAVGVLIATIVFAIKSGDHGNNPPVRTSP